MFEFYKRQIEDFNRSEVELNALIEDISNSDDITNEEYSKLYEMAINKLRG